MKKKKSLFRKVEKKIAEILRVDSNLFFDERTPRNAKLDDLNTSFYFCINTASKFFFKKSCV